MAERAFEDMPEFADACLQKLEAKHIKKLKEYEQWAEEEERDWFNCNKRDALYKRKGDKHKPTMEEAFVRSSYLGFITAANSSVRNSCF